MSNCSCQKTCRIDTSYTSAIDKQKEAIALNEKHVEELNRLNASLEIARNNSRLKKARQLAALAAREEAEKQHKIKLAEITSQHLKEVKSLNDTLIKNVDSLTSSIAEINEQLASPETLLPAFIVSDVEKLKDYFKITSEDKREILITYDQLDYILYEKDQNYKEALECLYLKLDEAVKVNESNKKNISTVVNSVTDLIRSNQVNKASIDAKIEDLSLKLEDVETANANDIRNLTKLVNSVATLLEKLESRVSDLEENA